MDRVFYGKDIPQENLPEESNGSPQRIISEESVKEAMDILARYKSGRGNFEKRIVEDELWYEGRHWEAIRNSTKKDTKSPTPSSAWLFNTITSKHADAMDNYPIAAVLPRERSDEEAAKTLSSVLPVVMEANDFENTYSAGWWEKLKHGTAAYFVGWNDQKENGLGDIDIRNIDLLNIFWEPGIGDIQKSRNLFILELADKDIVAQQYPELEGIVGSDASHTIKEYFYDDSVDLSNKTVLVDWYYKVMDESGRTILHYCKFCSGKVLFATENDPQYRESGLYDHGMYPIVLDVLFPEKGTPCGFGMVSVCKEPQMYIDKISGNILENAIMSTKKRFFVSNSTALKEDEFADFTNTFVHVEGELNDARIREIVTQPISPIYQSIVQTKIDEMKDTSSNKDVSTGSTGSGVTSGAAISALQEAANKQSRDMISASYRAFTQICRLCIELMRQHYDIARSFRITGTIPGQTEFIDMSNIGLKDQKSGTDIYGNDLYRHPVFDLKIKAMKRNPFSRMEENERAKELYSMGFFKPDNAQSALNALNMMDFEGIEKVREQIATGMTLQNQLIQAQQQLQQMSMLLAQYSGIPFDGSAEQTAAQGQNGQKGSGSSLAARRIDSAQAAQEPKSAYAQTLMKRAVTDMNR